MRNKAGGGKGGMSLLINGGMTMLQAGLLSQEHGFPVVAMNGTGRLADVCMTTMLVDDPDFEIRKLEASICETLSMPTNRIDASTWQKLDGFLRGDVQLVNVGDDEAGFEYLVKDLLTPQSSGLATRLARNEASLAAEIAAIEWKVRFVTAGFIYQLDGARCRPSHAFPAPCCATSDE
jgi:hypothetical protein